MRFANGLLKEGRKLLHWLTHIFVGFFILNFLLIWPVKYIWKGQNYQDSVKGKLCMKANFTGKFGTDAELSVKPLLLLISHTLVFWCLMHFYFVSSLKIKYEQGPILKLDLISLKSSGIVEPSVMNLRRPFYLFVYLFILSI